MFKEKNIKNILAVRNDRFGEFLLNIPALRALKTTFTGARLILITAPNVVELAEGIPFVDEVVSWRHQAHGLSESIKLIRLLKSKRIDISVILNPSKEFNILTFLSGIPVRVGYERKLGFLLNRRIKDKKYLGQKHEIDYNLELVRSIGADTQDKSLSLNIDDCLINDLFTSENLSNGQDLVAIHPWTSDSIKQWPIERFHRLAKRLNEELNVQVLIIGGRDEVLKSKDFCSGLDKNIINLTGRTSLLQLAALLKRCKLLISADSGPVHMASAVGKPVLAIFSNQIAAKGPIRWGPRSKGSLVIEKRSLSDITVDQVLTGAKEVLEG